MEQDEQLLDIITEVLSDSKTPIIYFIRCNKDYVKIGTSKGNVWRRMHDLQIGNPYELVFESFIFGGNEVERKIHKEVAQHWIRGEWHKMSKKQVKDLIKTIQTWKTKK